MISYEIFCKIRRHRDHDGLNKSQIAKALSLDLRTVEKWLEEKQFKQRKSSSRPSKLDPFKPAIVQMLETHPYSAKQVFQRIQEEGFIGGYTIVKDYVRKMRPRKSPAYLKLAFAPGECAQVDWGSFGSIAIGDTKRRLSFFIMVMCYSRMMYLEFFEALQRAGREWLNTIANQRIHGETRKKPQELFNEERLNSLPSQEYDCATIAQMRASSQFRITLDSNRYSVPAEYANCKLAAKIYADRHCVYEQDKLVARHQRSYDRHQDFENPDHPKELLAQRRKAHDQQILRRFLSISAKAQSYYQKFEDRRMNPFAHIRKIVALSEIYGPEAVSRAIDDAFVFEAFSCEYIANLLEQRTRVIKEPAALHLTRKKDLLDLNVDEPNIELYTI